MIAVTPIMITRLILVLASGLLIAVPATAGIDVLPPSTVIGQFTCADLLALDDTARERALIYLTGVTAGRRGTRTLDAERAAAAIDRVLTLCPTTPSKAVLDALMEASQ